MTPVVDFCYVAPLETIEQLRQKLQLKINLLVVAQLFVAKLTSRYGQHGTETYLL